LPSTLAPNTTYYWWVRAVCSSTNSSIWIQGPTFTTTQIPATLPYYQPFTSNDFGFVNGSQPNKWYYGSATGNRRVQYLSLMIMELPILMILILQV
jgi:hypothetical protein